MYINYFNIIFNNLFNYFLKLRIYYINNKTSNLVLKNNCAAKPVSPLKRSHLIYFFNCSYGECGHHNSQYIGMTTTTLNRRLTLHKQEGAIKNHLRDNHNITITREILDNNTKILYYNNDFFQVKII